MDEILLLYPFNVSFASVLRFSARSGVTLVELTAACVKNRRLDCIDDNKRSDLKSKCFESH